MRALRGRMLAAVAALSLAATGCALFANRSHTDWLMGRPRFAPSGAQGPATGYTDYVGVMHVHTREYSHDAHGKLAEVIRAGNQQELDFVILTEHNTWQHKRDGVQGWHGRTLILTDVEISTNQGHYVALNVPEEINRDKLSAQQIIDEVNRQGGLGFIAHPYFKNGRWRDWQVRGFQGIEAYNVAHDTLDENKPRLALWTLTAPVEPFYESILDRPYDALSSWDEMIRRHGRVVGIGSTDAHEFHALGIKFAPYDIMFQLIRNHVWVPSDTLTPEGVYDALRQGHSYLAIELIRDAKGFSFVALVDGKVVGVMGDEVPWQKGLTLDVTVPTETTMALFKDGQPHEHGAGASWQVPITEPGAYRVEAPLRGKPWIFSNPIYVTAPAKEKAP